MALTNLRKWRFKVPASATQGDLAQSPVIALIAAQAPARGAADRSAMLCSAMLEAGALEPLPEIQTAARSAPKATGWALSYAHTGEHVLAAATPGGPARSLGVDIERTRPRDFRRIEGYLGWEQASSDLPHFYRRWTLAEALLKALGGAHAKATFDALDCALESASESDGRRAARLDRWQMHAMWPQLGGDVTACWLLAEAQQA